MGIRGININRIIDFAAPEMEVYTGYSEAQLAHIYEPETGLFIAESPLVIERALNSGYLPMSFLIEESQIKGLAGELIGRFPEVPVYTAELDVLTKLTGFQLTRGMLCAMYRTKLPSVEEVCSGAARIAVMENVVNPTNVGAIFRSAAALNMDAVLLTSGCSDPLYRRAVRVSMGTVFQVPWTYLNNRNGNSSVTDISTLRELGFKTVAMALSDTSVSIDHPALVKEERLAVILGTEGEGLAAETIAGCDYTAKIPMAHGVDSLNVAAASAVAFWQLGRH